MQREDGAHVTQSPASLGKRFAASVKECLQGERLIQWRSALRTLETDPIFEEFNVARLAELPPGDVQEEAQALYKKLSSGHKIVLLTITQLVEAVEERSLVLMDEPEAHLHPPLLSALTRAISALVIDRNGVAIVATHSPVVLQEVPRSCAYRLERAGDRLCASRLSVETFGENVGVLTHQVFGLEVGKSGFHQLLSDFVSRDTYGARDYESAVEYFNGQLGGEARGVLRALLQTKAARRRRAEGSE